MPDRSATGILLICLISIVWLFVRSSVASIEPTLGQVGDIFVCFLCLPSVFQMISLALLAMGIDASKERQAICFNTGLILLRVATCFDIIHRLIPGNPFTVGAPTRQVMIGFLLQAMEKKEEASRHCKQFIKNNDKDSMETADCKMILAEIAMQDGNYKEGKELADECLKMVEGSNRSEFSKGAALTNLCASYMKLGLIDESISAGLKAVSSYDSANPIHNQLQATCYNNLGLAYSYAGDYEEAYNCAKRSFKLKKAGSPQPNVSHAIAHVNLSESLLMLERYEEALAEATEAHSILDRLGFKDDLIRATAAQNTGAALVGLGRFDEAKVELLASLKSKKKFMAAKDPEWFSIYTDLGKLYAGLNEQDAAEKYFRDAMNGLKNQLGEKHPRLAYVALEYAKFLEANNRMQEASDLRAEAESINSLRSKKQT